MLSFVAILVSSTPADAQTEVATRHAGGGPPRRRAANRPATRPHQPNALERGLESIRGAASSSSTARASTRSSAVSPVGSGFAYGPATAIATCFNNAAPLDLGGRLHGAATSRPEGRIRFPELADKRLLVEGWAGRRDYSGEYFFGLGPDSDARSHQSDYGLRSTIVGAQAGGAPLRRS